MAFPTSQESRHDQPVGGGFHGPSKSFAVQVANGVAKEVYFDGFKIANPDSAVVLFSDAYTNASSEAVGGAPATSKVISSDGKKITLTHNANANLTFTIFADWQRI